MPPTAFDHPRPRARRLLGLLAIPLALAAGACGGKKQPSTIVTATQPVRPRPPSVTRPAPAPQTATLTPSGPASESLPSFAPIGFDFDSSLLSDAARVELQQLADWMARHPGRLAIEGNADERGTTEYNLALGQERADAIARHLTRLGVDGGRLTTISYGEERPAIDGSDETAWAANRRGDLRPDR